MADIIRLPSADDKKPHYAIAAMCIVCGHRWLGLVVASTSLFGLECSACGSQKSFASFLPQGYLEDAARGPDTPSAS